MGKQLILQDRQIFRKEENGMTFRVEMNEHSTLVTRITMKNSIVYDDSNYLLVGENRNSTLIVRCDSAEEAEKKYNTLECTKHKMSFKICQNYKIKSSEFDYYIDFMKKNSHLCKGHCGKCTVCDHPLMAYHCMGFTIEELENMKYRSLNDNNKTEDVFDDDEDLYLEDEDEDDDDDEVVEDSEEYEALISDLSEYF